MKNKATVTGYVTEANLPDYARERLQKKVAEVFGKHTPGPWKQVGGTEVWEERCVYRICNCGGSYGPPPIVMRANARLIAAAPELLEVVQLYLELSPNQPPNLSALARAAIAKAEGK